MADLPYFGTHSSPLKNSQLLRRRKKFKLSRMNKYASTLIRLPGRQSKMWRSRSPQGPETGRVRIAFLAPCTWGF
ncbi:hypothetical protein [Desulfonatronum sp. SC1]|uniref:hypothetical protein n=1 Tax=Desulfonatronum sp. SC1 TaxID=2109626 RepID=UPI0011B29030|nr:hypothetical protein [Desulfonatronum sp. SC1]